MKKACLIIPCQRYMRTLNQCFKLSTISTLIQLLLSFLRWWKYQIYWNHWYFKVGLTAASTTDQDILTSIVKFFAHRSCNCLYKNEIVGNIRIKGSIWTIEGRYIVWRTLWGYEEVLHVVGCFQIFSPSSLPSEDCPSFLNHSQRENKKVAAYYYKDETKIIEQYQNKLWPSGRNSSMICFRGMVPGTSCDYATWIWSSLYGVVRVCSNCFVCTNNQCMARAWSQCNKTY